MKTIKVTVRPYAMQEGFIEVPDDVKDVYNYVIDNWEDVDFDSPELDYEGTDVDVEE